MSVLFNDFTSQSGCHNMLFHLLSTKILIAVGEKRFFIKKIEARCTFPEARIILCNSTVQANIEYG